MKFGLRRKTASPSEPTGGLGLPIFVRTPSEPWAYGRVIPIDRRLSTASLHVRVAGWVLRGNAAIVTTGADLSRVADQRHLPSATRPTPFLASLVVPEEGGAHLIVRTGPDGVSTDLLIEEIAFEDHSAATALGEPGDAEGRSRWNLALDGGHAESAAERLRAMELVSASEDRLIPWYGGPLSVPTGSQAGMALAITGTYEPGLLQVLRRLIPRGGTIVNAGGHIGILATYLAWLGGPTSTVIAVEPSRRERSRLIDNAAARRDSGVIEVVEAALGAEEGTAFVHLASDLLSGHNSISNDQEPDGELVVITTVDSLTRSRPMPTSAIVLDVEGMEREVLAGARETIARDRPLLTLEFEPGRMGGATHDEMVREILALDYEAVIVETSSGHAAPFPHVPAGSAWAVLARPMRPATSRLLEDIPVVAYPARPTFNEVNGGIVVRNGTGLTVITPARAWEYGASAHVDQNDLGRGDLVFASTMRATSGAADLLLVDTSLGTILEGTRLSPAARVIRLALPSRWECPRGVEVVLRTADTSTGSSVAIEDARFERPGDAPLNPPLFPLRPEQTAPAATSAGTVVFENELATAINTARLNWLASLPIDWAARRVVDLGCGIGLFARFFLERGADYTGLEGRAENIAAARLAVPEATFLQADARDVDLAAVTDVPDVALAFGLLYHLDEPLAFLKNIGRSAAELLILETMISDFGEPVVLRYPEPSDANQALDGVGCRPSIPWLVETLRSVGFTAIGTTPAPPDYPDFQFRPYADGSTQRGGSNLRVALVAARDSRLLPHGLVAL